MTVPQQSPQILQLLGRQPDRRKAVFHQQCQNQFSVSPIMFLLPWFGCPNHCRITDLAFVNSLSRRLVQKSPVRSAVTGKVGTGTKMSG